MGQTNSSPVSIPYPGRTGGCDVRRSGAFDRHCGCGLSWWKASRRKYVVDHDTCTCPGFSTAPEGLCTHRAAVAIARRADASTRKLLADPGHMAMLHRGCPSHLTRHKDGPCWSY